MRLQAISYAPFVAANLFVLLSLSHVSSNKFPTVAAAPNYIPTKESGSWIDGMEFEEIDPTTISQDFHLDKGPLLQVPCGIMLHQDVNTIRPVEAILDTGSRQSVMSYEGAKKAGILELVDTTCVKSGSGSSSCKVFGYVAPNFVDLRMGSEEATMGGPRIAVLQKSEAQTVDLILGMDFLRKHQGIIDLRQEELHLINAQGDDVMVPFLRPRATLSFDERAPEEETKDDVCRNINTCGTSN